MKDTLQSRKFPLAVRPAIAFCLFSCVLISLLPSTLFAGYIKGWGSKTFDSSAMVGPFTAISAGYYHSVALKSDGSIVGWGNNYYGQVTPPTGNNFIAIEAGQWHSLALKTDGSIVGWGSNSNGQATPPAGNNFIAIAAGLGHSLALKSDGSIIGWGSNSYGQATPPVGNNYIAIAAGDSHSLALKSDGSIVAWGYNASGQATPPLGNNFIAIAAGGNHSLALKSDGSIVGWGDNTYGQARPPNGNNFIAIAAGYRHSLALKSDGSIVGWGYNGSGQATPPAGNNFIAIAAGYEYSLALKSDGSIVGWGWNRYGQVTTPAGNNFVTIATKFSHSLALKSDHSIFAWGENGDGECNVPLPNSGFIAIAAGEGHSLALKSDGSIVGWGYNRYGQATSPAGNNFIAIAAGYYHSLALKSDGSIIAWGSNSDGQTTSPAGNNFIAITAGYYHSLALKSDGSIAGWGYNGSGQRTPPLGNNFTAIAAGWYHSLALKSDGSIVAWGSNGDGQCNVPLPNTGFIAIAAGGNHCLALKSDGSLVGWGDNFFGQATPPAGHNFIAIAAGYDYSLALRRSPFSDLNNDVFVDFIDYSIFAKNWQRTPFPGEPNNGDITKDGYVNIYDFAELAESWLACFVDPATKPMPLDKSTNISRYAVLQWTPGDKSASHDIYFGTDFNEVNNANFDNLNIYMGNQDANSWDTNNFDSNSLVFNTKYYWRIDEVNNHTTKGNVWDFTTVSGKAKNPQPNNNRQYVTTHSILSWSAGEDAVSHNIYFGTDFDSVNNADITSSGIYMGNQDANFWDTNNYAPAGLNFSTTYYWRIDEVNDCTTKGDLWAFTTASGKSKNPQPNSDQNNINLQPILSWSPGTDAISHNVYFGTDFNTVNDADITSSDVYMGNQDANCWDTNNYAPAGLAFYTTYYWRIDEVASTVTIKGDVWSFTTKLDPTLVAWWEFEEGAGLLAYDTAGHSDGNLVGGPVWTNGKIGGGLSFDGIDDYINCGSGPSNYNNITVSVWMKTSTQTQGVLVSNRYNTSDYGTWYTLYSSWLKLGGNSSGIWYKNVLFNTPTLDGFWHHIVYTKDGTNHTIYIDGVLDQNFTSGANISQNTPFYIGKKWETSSANWFNGIIDDVRIYNRALSAAEVAQLYSQ